MHDSDPRTRTTPRHHAVVAPRAYLLLLEGDGSSLFPLPAAGSVTIGRGDEADVRLAQQDVSRRHATLSVDGGVALLQDLESHNGTRVNGVALSGPRELLSGATIAICDCTLVFHVASRGPAPRALLDAAAFRRRLEEEIERAVEYRRPLGLLSVLLGAGARSREELAAGAHALRAIDVAGAGAPSELLVLMPERPLASAAAAAVRFLEENRTQAPGARAGLATLPEDGFDAEVLLATARAAAAQAQPGRLFESAGLTTRLQLGGREVIVAEPAMLKLYDLLRRIAPTELPVLISGETGTGKEHAAWAVHQWSLRSKGPFVALNCAAVAEGLFESELFGHEKGAFTGATSARAGLFESASGGTLFLDEAGELPPPVQAKLLRTLETGAVRRVGSAEERVADVRVVAATNRDLAAEAEAGRFRKDLLFRLSAAHVQLPPLRDRPRELAVLARAFLDAECARSGRPARSISGEAMRALTAHAWPGNVRELKNAVEFAAASAEGATLERWHLPLPLRGDAREEKREAPPDAPAFRPIAEEVADLERRRISEALAAAGQNRTRAAALIGMPLRTFITKLKHYGLAPKPG